MKYNLVHADTCLPDYWGGHHLPHVSVPVDGNITVKEVFAQIRSEISQGAFGGSFDPDLLDSEEFYAACIDALQEMQELNSDKLDTPAFPDLELFDDSGESVMVFFVFVPEEEEED